MNLKSKFSFLKIRMVLLMASLTLGVSIILVGCGNNKTDSSEAQSDSSSSSQVESSSQQEESMDLTEDILKDKEKLAAMINENLTDETKINQMVESLNQGFSQYMSISYDADNKNFLLVPQQTDNLLSKQLNKAAQNPSSSMSQTIIKGLGNSLISFSDSVSTELGAGYSLILKSPNEGQPDLFVIKDGEITYPAF